MTGGLEATLRAMVIAADESAAAPLRKLLEAVSGLSIVTGGIEEALPKVAAGEVDVAVLAAAPLVEIERTLARLREVSPRLPVLVVTRPGDRLWAAMTPRPDDIVAEPLLSAPFMTRALRLAVERTRGSQLARKLRETEQALRQSQQAEARAVLLSEVSDALSVSFDYTRTLNRVAELMVRGLGDACLVEVHEADGHCLRVGWGWRDDDGSQVRLEVPLQARGHTVGRLVLARPGGPFSHEEDAVAGECARKIAVAVETARMFQAREEVVGVVAHDLRNPLGTIKLAAGSLARADASAATAAQLERIERAVETMNRLIGDLLDLSRLEASSLPMDRRPVEAESLLADACEMVRTLAEDRGIGLGREVSGPLPPVHADRDRLLQVLANLLGNALKFTPAGGTITVAAHREGADVHFEVTDTGPGIALSDVPHVFDRFWRADASRPGVGLGLAIAQRIVQAHEGRIGVHSRPGAGSTFYFTLPAVEQSGRPGTELPAA